MTLAWNRKYGIVSILILSVGMTIQCDIEALKCDVICSFPAYASHCQSCTLRRPMRFGKRMTPRTNTKIQETPFNNGGEIENKRIVTFYDNNLSYPKINSGYPNPMKYVKEYYSKRNSPRSINIRKVLEDIYQKQKAYKLYLKSLNSTEESSSSYLPLNGSNSEDWRQSLVTRDVDSIGKRRANKVEKLPGEMSSIIKQQPLIQDRSPLEGGINLKAHLYLPIYNKRNINNHFKLSKNEPEQKSTYTAIKRRKRRLSHLLSDNLSRDKALSAIKNIINEENISVNPAEYGCHNLFL